MKIGFLFPGQGAQSVGMGKDLYDKYEEYRAVYNKINNITGLNLEKITFEETEEVLNKTNNTQIAILTMSLAILELLKNNEITAIASAGLSLGEYTALIHSKAISIEEGVKIVKKRGELMNDLCPKGEWAMAAVLGLDEQKVVSICSKIKSGFISPANFNCSGQIVVSGESKAINEMMILAKEDGAKKVVELKTSGPFHTKMLEKASEELRKELETIKINNFQTKVVKNLDGKEYTLKDNIKNILALHITNPVRFEDCIKTMISMGIDTFIEIGPGKTLSGFVKRTSKDVKILNINDVNTLEEVKKELKNG